MTANFAIIFMLATNAVLACEQKIKAPSLDELARLEEEFNTSTSTAVQIVKYKQMLATSDPDIRQAYIEMGMTHKDQPIRATALKCQFIHAKAFREESLPYEEAINIAPNMSQQEIDLVEKGYTQLSTVYFMDEEKGCASIHRIGKTKCSPKQQAVLTNLSIAIIRDKHHSTFELVDGVLVGTVSLFDGRGGTIDVPAILSIN